MDPETVVPTVGETITVPGVDNATVHAAMDSFWDRALKRTARRPLRHALIVRAMGIVDDHLPPSPEASGKMMAAAPTAIDPATWRKIVDTVLTAAIALTAGNPIISMILGAAKDIFDQLFAAPAAA